MGRHKAERFGVGQASGVLGGVTRPEDGAKKGRSGMGGPWSGTSRSSNFGSARVKSEPWVKSERDRDGDVSMGGFGGKRIKTEGGYVSSDEEPDAAAGPRVNIEHINLVSDEDSDGEVKSNKGKERAKSVKAPGWALKPVRLDRHEHLERVVGVSTEASPLTSAELRKKAQEKDEAEGSLFIPQEEGESATIKTEKKKPTAKRKDVEFVRNERKWKGVYQDSDVSDNDTPKIKDEPIDESDAMLIDTPPAATTTTKAVTTSPKPTSATDDPAPKQEAPTPTPSKPKRHRKSIPRAPKPVLQTEEDRAEWARHEEDIQILADELGLSASIALPPVTKSNPLSSTTTTGTDADGDTPIPEAGAEAEAETQTPAQGDASTEKEEDDGKRPRKDKKDGHVYLFQFPPLVPTLLDPVVKSEDPDPDSPASNDAVETSSRLAPPTAAAAAAAAGSASHKTPPIIKPDPDRDVPFSSSIEDTKHHPSSSSSSTLDHSSAAVVVSTSALGGLLGWLTVHEDGECVVSWGGPPFSEQQDDGGDGSRKGEVLSMTLARGGEGELLQEVMVVDVGGGARAGAETEAEGGGEGGDDCGGRGRERERGRGRGKEEAWAVGQLVGGFVVMPDWGRVLGGG